MIESIEKLRASQYVGQHMSLSEIADEIEAEIESRYMLLPVDADGVPIHINDRMEDNERVARIVISDGEWEPSVYLEKLSYPRVLHEHFCHEISHFNPRTIEDVLEEFYHAVLNHDMDNTRLEQYADEIRELMEVDG